MNFRWKDVRSEITDHKSNEIGIWSLWQKKKKLKVMESAASAVALALSTGAKL
jgi:hypothetical protein